jgi:hypothetical protein
MEELTCDYLAALTICWDDGILYCFCKSFAINVRFVFQVTDSTKHPIELQAIRAICNHICDEFGEEEKVNFMLVVAKEVGCERRKKGNDWQYTQSFKLTGIGGVNDGVKICKVNNTSLGYQNVSDNSREI